MATKDTNGVSHLYMRVDDTVSYDISRGAGVEFAGMTRDGSKVYFATTVALTGEDTDTEKDLYMWSEAGDQLTLVSQGAGNGNSESCHAAWTNSCDIVLLKPEREHPNTNSAVSAPGLDDIIAEDSGDVYFYSPEQLDPAAPAVPNGRNLLRVPRRSGRSTSPP